jgi:hypothetical protein
MPQEMHYSDMFDPTFLEIHDNLSHTTQTISLAEKPLSYQGNSHSSSQNPKVGTTTATGMSKISFTIKSGIVTTSNSSLLHSSSSSSTNMPSRGRSSSISAPANSYFNAGCTYPPQSHIASSPVVNPPRALNKRPLYYDHDRAIQSQGPSNPRASSHVSRIVNLTPQITLRTRVLFPEPSEIDKKLLSKEILDENFIADSMRDFPLPPTHSTAHPLAKKTNSTSLAPLKPKFPHLQPKLSTNRADAPFLDKENFVPGTTSDIIGINPIIEKVASLQSGPLDEKQLRTNNEWLLRKKEVYGSEYGNFLESLVLDGMRFYFVFELPYSCRPLGNYRRR